MEPKETEMDKDILDYGCDFIKANELPGKKFEKRYESKNYIDFSANKERERSEDWFLKERFIHTWKCLTYR